MFAREFTVYNYDRRGRGDSTDTLPYAMEREVEDIEAVIDAAGGRASLYGHSSGAVLALEAALRLGGRIDKVVMYDPAYVHDEAEKSQYANLGELVHALLRGGKNAQAMRTFRDLPPLDRASRVSVPVQLIVGEKSQAGIQEVASQLATAIPRATLIHLAGQNHMVSATALLPVLASFLKTPP